VQGPHQVHGQAIPGVRPVQGENPDGLAILTQQNVGLVHFSLDSSVLSLPPTAYRNSVKRHVNSAGSKPVFKYHITKELISIKNLYSLDATIASR
jgi:hypothetical protein